MTLVGPTPTFDGVLALRPELAGPYRALLTEAAAGLDPDLHAVIRSRFAALHGLPGPLLSPEGQLQQRAVEFAELFVIDVHAISDELAADIVGLMGEAGLVALASACAVADGEAKLRRVLEVST